MKSVPEFWSPLEQTFGEAYLTTWVDEFINYETVIAQLESEEDDVLEPEVINPPKKERKK